MIFLLFFVIFIFSRTENERVIISMVKILEKFFHFVQWIIYKCKKGDYLISSIALLLLLLWIVRECNILYYYYLKNVVFIFLACIIIYFELLFIKYSFYLLWVWIKMFSVNWFCWGNWNFYVLFVSWLILWNKGNFFTWNAL